MTPLKDDTQEIDFCQEFQTVLHEKGRLAVRRGRLCRRWPVCAQPPAARPAQQDGSLPPGLSWPRFPIHYVAGG
jgi:hypothetical protein